MTRNEVIATFAIPPLAAARLDAFAALLTDWQSRMNLVANSTLPDVWGRHFADSIQLAGMVPANDDTVWLDIGSGAGFPALVLALVAPGHFHLVEATAKKCAFLRDAAKVLGVDERVTIHATRIEGMPVFAADIVTARACAPLTQLFNLGERFARDRWLLLKGRTVADEVSAARNAFTFDAELVASRTDAAARIVVASNVGRRR